MLTILIKCFHFGNYPAYLKRLFIPRAGNCYLRGTNMLSLPKSLTTTYGLFTLRNYTAKLWLSP